MDGTRGLRRDSRGELSYCVKSGARFVPTHTFAATALIDVVAMTPTAPQRREWPHSPGYDTVDSAVSTADPIHAHDISTRSPLSFFFMSPIRTGKMMLTSHSHSDVHKAKGGRSPTPPPQAGHELMSPITGSGSSSLTASPVKAPTSLVSSASSTAPHSESTQRGLDASVGGRMSSTSTGMCVSLSRRGAGKSLVPAVEQLILSGAFMLETGKYA
jgi:hypothetical protein